jgi:hypothetical protein
MDLDIDLDMADKKNSHENREVARPSHVWLPTFYLFDLFDLQLTCN